MKSKGGVRLSEAYEVLARFGLDARGIEDHGELLRRFQPLRAQYKNGPGERAEVYEKVIRPAFVTVANAIKNIHPKLHRDECTHIVK